MRVLSVTPELFPLIKTGGLADVAGALPGALAPLGVEMRSLLPAYPAVLAGCQGATVTARLEHVLGQGGRLLEATVLGRTVYLLDLPALYDRPGNPYVGPDGRDWGDNALRFAALARTAADIGMGLLADWRPDVVHAHDWQAGLAAAYLAFDAEAGRGQRPATVQTIHNLAFQGQVDPWLMGLLGLPAHAFHPGAVEYYGAIGMLKAGVRYADKVTTVSPTYAREIRTDGGGMGMAGLLRARGTDLLGIVNGLDTAVWDPAGDPHLPVRFSAADPSGKAACKRTLQERLGLAVTAEAPLLAVVSRLTHQKGLDLVLEGLSGMVERGCQLAVLGSGETALEAGFARAALAMPDRVACRLGYDEPLAHLMQAGADVILVPSRFEPCGLTQLIGLRYGALPLVGRVGGLADTVIDASLAALADGVATGFQMPLVTADGLMDALDRMATLWADQPAWARVRARAMTREVGWDASARRYRALYETALASLA